MPPEWTSGFVVVSGGAVSGQCRRRHYTKEFVPVAYALPSQHRHPPKRKRDSENKLGDICTNLVSLIWGRPRDYAKLLGNVIHLECPHLVDHHHTSLLQNVSYKSIRADRVNTSNLRLHYTIKDHHGNTTHERHADHVTDDPDNGA